MSHFYPTQGLYQCLIKSIVEPIWLLYNFKKVFDGQCAGQKNQIVTHSLYELPAVRTGDMHHFLLMSSL
jgi:hypothetical protein